MNAIFLDSFTSFFGFVFFLFSFQLFTCQSYVFDFTNIYSFAILPIMLKRPFDSMRLNRKSRNGMKKNRWTSKTCYLLYDEINQVFAQVCARVYTTYTHTNWAQRIEAQKRKLKKIELIYSISNQSNHYQLMSKADVQIFYMWNPLGKHCKPHCTQFVGFIYIIALSNQF